MPEPHADRDTAQTLPLPPSTPPGKSSLGPSPSVGLQVVIAGVHAIVFSQDAERTRAFFRDTLGLSFVDAGDGWLIFALPHAELAAHPSDAEPRHELYLMCEDIHAAVAELKGSGVEFATEIADERWGLTTRFHVPGGGQMALYQPRHARPGVARD